MNDKFKGNDYRWRSDPIHTKLSCYPVKVHSWSQTWEEAPIDKAFKPIWIQAPNKSPH